MSRLPRLLAAGTALWLAGSAAAQIPPGRFVLPSADPNVPLTVAEPLRGAVTPLLDPQRLLPTTPAAVTPSPFRPGSGWIAALHAPGATTSALVDFTTLQDRITNVRPLVRSIPGAVVSLATLEDGSVLVVTAGAVHSLTSAGGLTPLLRAAAGETFVDVHAEDTGFVALSSLSATGAALLYLPTPTGGNQVRRVSIRGAHRIAPDPNRSGYLLGDRAGSVWFVDRARFVAQRIATLPGAQPIQALVWNPDRRHHLVAAAAQAWLFDGRLLGTPLPLPSPVSGAARYRGYDSAVSRYGAGCGPAQGGPPQPESAWSGTPQPGSNDFVVLLRNSVPAVPTWLLLGVAANSLPLDALGMPACRLLVDPLDSLPGRSGALGTSAQRLPIPADPALVGARLFTQWLTLAPGANRAGALASDALAIRF